MHGSGDRTDQLARRVLAVHAEYGLVIRGRPVEIAFVVAVDADPVHLAATRDLLLTDDRNVVLRLAGDHTGAAAGAGAQIDGHAPGIAFVLHFGIEGELWRRGLFHFPGELGIGAIRGS